MAELKESSNTDQKICPNCGFLNEFHEISCQKCGNNFSVSSADLIQMAKDESNFLGDLAKGNYDRKPWKIILASLVGLIMVCPVLLSYGFVISDYFKGDADQIDVTLFIVLTPFLILLVVGLMILFQAIKKAIIK